MTTLEGEMILDYIRVSRPELLKLIDELPLENPAHGTTTNQFARACLQNKTIEDLSLWNLEPCIFLHKCRCSIYPVRSFMCRSFGSKIRCDIAGTAEVDPLFMTLNTVIMQCIEHLDHGRPWGNMNMILRSLANRQENGPQLLAEKIPGFLIPPDEAARIDDQVQKLLDILNGID